MAVLRATTCFSSSLKSSSLARSSCSASHSSSRTRPRTVPHANTANHGFLTLKYRLPASQAPIPTDDTILMNASPTCITSTNSIPHGSYTGRSLPPLRYEFFPADASPSGLPRLRFKPMDLVYHPYSADCTPSQAVNTRLHEIISRVGEICLSPELAHVMLFPAQARAHQSGLTSSVDFPDAHRATACDPATVLSIMSDAPLTGHAITQAGKFLSRFQQDILPEPITTQYRQPIHICAWKLDLPSRVCLYTGEHPKDPSTLDLSSFMPHTLSKVLLEERSRRQDPSRFHILQDPGSLSADAIRTSLLHYAQTALTPHKARIPGIAQHALDHTLEEAVACLVQAPTRNHTTIALNQSPPWDKDHIDSRCVNGGRGFNQCTWAPFGQGKRAIITGLGRFLSVLLVHRQVQDISLLIFLIHVGLGFFFEDLVNHGYSNLFRLVFNLFKCKFPEIPTEDDLSVLQPSFQLPHLPTMLHSNSKTVVGIRV
jgi:hypothetical protein